MSEEVKTTPHAPKVSVIVPVYKAEKYLRKCVDSILTQTFRDFEVILVDDGSPDGSGAICDEYARKDPRVRVFHKENGGVSSARQCGLDHARGEYTIHADPDDWVEPNMLEELYVKAKAEDADMVICDYYVNDSRGQRYVRQQPSALDHETVLRELFQQLHGSCWNKLVRRACYRTYEVRFPREFSFCEDVYVNTSLLKNEIRVAYLPKAFYHYEQEVNSESIVRKNNIKSYEQDAKQLAAFGDLLQGASCSGEAMSSLSLAVVMRAIYRSSYTSREFRVLYGQYKDAVFSKKNLSLKERCLLTLSFHGFYGIVRRLIVLHSKIRNI